MMAGDLYNDDVVIDTVDDLDNATSSSNVSDDSSSTTPPDVSDDITRVIDGWIADTTDTGGTPGETHTNTPPTELPPLTPPVYTTVTRTIQEIITNYNQTYLQQLAEQGGTFYVYYTDGTRDEVEYTEIVDPHVARAQTLVFEVDEITQANNQHFWHDNNGAHVTDETRDSWEENVAYNFSDLSDNNNHNNLLMNSYGLVIRRALKNLAAFSRSAVTFYDGDGNEASNILAMFGKNGIQIGTSEQSRIVLNSNGFSYFSEDGVNLFNLSINNASDETKYAYSDLIPCAANSTENIDLSQVSFSVNHSVYRMMRLWPPYEDTRIDIMVTLNPGNQAAISKIASFLYGEETDGWVNWTYGQYRYDGEDTVDVYSTTNASVYVTLSKPISISRYNFGDCISEGDYSFAEGHKTQAKGFASHAEGENTIAYGYSSHAEGDQSFAEGVCSHAEGSSSALGVYSHAEGYSSSAIGIYSHAEGISTETTQNGSYSHVQNLGTISDGECQTIIGKYNQIDGTLPFIIGNGLSDNARSNCLEVDWNGAVDFGPQAISRNTNATLVMANRSTQTDYGGLYICDKNANVSDYVVRQHIRENANNGVRWYRTEISRTVNNSRAYNAFSIGLDASNNAVYGVSNPSAFRSAINAVDAGRLEIVNNANPRFVIYGTSGTAIDFTYNPTTKNLAARGFDGSSWTNFGVIITLT